MSWQLGTLAMIMLVLGAGMLWYERSRPPSQIVALVAVLAALAVAGRILLAPIPNVVATTDIVFFAGYALGPAPGFAVGALGGLVSNFWLGQGVWTPWQMVGWGMTGVAGGVFWHLTRGRTNRFALALACGLAGLAFGAWMNFQSMVSFGGEITLDRYLALEARAIPFDAAHIFGNVVFALAAGPAIIAALRRFRERFEWGRVTPVAGILLVVASLGTVLLAPPAEAAVPTSAQEGRKWLVSQQNGDGGFPVSPDGESSLRITSRAMIGLAATGKNPLDVIGGDGSTPLDFMAASKGELTDASQIALAVLALKTVGVDPRDFEGRNLVQALKKRSGSNYSFGNDVNVSAWSVLAFRSAGAGDPASKTADWLRSAQNSAGDGGWGIAKGAVSDADSTGAALMAIGGTNAVQMAIEYLNRAQKSSGGFVSGSTVNSQSTGLVLQGLSAAGKGPRFLTSNGNSPVDYLEARQQEDGSIWYSKTSDQTRVWVTADAITGLSGRALPIGEPSRDSESGSGSSGTGGVSPGGSGGESGSSGSGSGSSGGSSGAAVDSGSVSTEPATGSGPGSPGTGTGSGSGNAATPGGSGGSSGQGSGSGGVPEIGVPLVPVAPSTALLAASRPGPQPSPVLALLIGLVIAGGLAGGTVLLVRKQGW